MQYIEAENKVVDAEGNLVAYIGTPGNLGSLAEFVVKIIPKDAPQPEAQPEAQTS